MTISFFFSGAEDFSNTNGGVNRIVDILKNKFEDAGHKVFLITNMPLQNQRTSDDVIYLPDNKLTTHENFKFIKKFVQQNKVDIFINEVAYSPECIELCLAVKDLTKVINVHNNCIKCLYDHYAHIFKTNRNPRLVKLVEKLNLWFLVKLLFKIRSKKVWQAAIGSSDAFIVYFDSFVNEFDELYKIKSDKIKVITNPSTYDDLSQIVDFTLKKKFVYVGRIVEVQKRIDKLLSLWHKLHDEFVDWTFDLVGEGNYTEKAKLYVKNNNLNRITFHGIQNPYQYWLDADIFTLTSDFEGFGMVLIESQSAATIPITFNCFSAIDEVVAHNESGIVVEDFDVENMYQAISDLLKDENKIKQMKKNGLKQALDFDQEKIANIWLKLFNELKSK